MIQDPQAMFFIGAAVMFAFWLAASIVYRFGYEDGRRFEIQREAERLTVIQEKYVAR